MPISTSEQITQCNASGRQPVVLIHGLWLLAGSWDRWVAVLEQAGYTPLAPGWPDEPDSVEEGNAHPGTFAGKTVGRLAEHFAAIVGQLERKPAVVGHSFGGLLAQNLAGRGLSAVSVAIDPAPFQGVLPIPISVLRSLLPVLKNPLNYGRAVALTEEQFRYAFTNAVGADEADELYRTYAVPAAGAPLFQAATANLNPLSPTKVDRKNPERGPLLIIEGAEDHAVAPAIPWASFKRQRRNPGVTECVEIAGRGHSLTIDSGCREVADAALAFVQRFAPA